MARPCIHARLATYRHFLDSFVQIRGKVNGGDDGRHDDAFVLDGQRQEDRQSVVGHLLVLHRASHDDIVVAFAPVVGHARHETVDALGEEEKPEVAPPFHHLPAIRPPRIGIFQQEVGGEAGEDHLAAFDLPRFVAFLPDRQVEVARFPALTARYLAAVHLILTIHIAVLAPRAYLGASVPRIPVSVYLPVLRHVRVPFFLEDGDENHSGRSDWNN